jgi:predicted regulator of Ras-like GTPase activity (Roadblock/LC7/MglB family)
MTKKKKGTQMVGQVTEPIVLEATMSVNDLKARLEELKNRDGVIGYILRNTTSASIDLKDPAKIIDFAVLSSSAIDASKELSNLFDLGNVNSTVVEGRNVKMLSLTIDENRISIFMEKNVDCEALRNTLCAKGPN